MGLSTHLFQLIRFPPEQPSDDGAEELARRAAAVVEGRWHELAGGGLEGITPECNWRGSPDGAIRAP
jgi:hypothetical protein